MRTKFCEVCGDSIHPLAFCCKRCKKLLDRLDTRTHIRRNKQARLDALKNGFNKSGKYFKCYYAHTRLNENNPRSPRYLTFDHFVPRDETKMVLTAALINDMKSDMTDEEFRSMVKQLASHFEGKPFNETFFKVKHWKR